MQSIEEYYAQLGLSPRPEEEDVMVGFQPFQKDQYQIAALLATLPDSDVELQRLVAEQARAEGLQGDGPEGRMVGNTYVAPQLTQYAAQLGDAWQGAQREREATARYDDSVSKRNTAVRELLNALRGRKSEVDEPIPYDELARSV